jgi:hypothetical protein
MKRKEISVALDSLNGVSELKGVKFAFCVLKNKKKIETQMEEDRVIFEQILKPSEGFNEYESKRVQLCVQFSDKDEQGNPVVENNQYKISNLFDFNTELTKISEEYQEHIDGRTKQVDEYNTLLEEDINLDFQKVKFEDLPADLSASQLSSLEFMINLD